MDGLNVLQRLGSGHLIDEIHAALLDVAEEVVATGKSGAVTVTLKVTHPKNTDPLLVVIEEDVKRTMPKTDPHGAMFFAHEAELHIEDPRQPQLPTFRVVADENGAVLRNPEDTGQAIREAE